MSVTYKVIVCVIFSIPHLLQVSGKSKDENVPLPNET